MIARMRDFSGVIVIPWIICPGIFKLVRKNGDSSGAAFMFSLSSI